MENKMPCTSHDGQVSDALPLREIKFRAWDKRTNSMFLVREMFWIVGGIEVDDGATTKRGFAPRDFVIMQYTGLKDSYNYEFAWGDLLKDEVTDEIYEVKDGLSAVLFENVTTKNVFYFWGLVNPLKLVGNIYETPALAQPEQTKQGKE